MKWDETVYSNNKTGLYILLAAMGFNFSVGCLRPVSLPHRKALLLPISPWARFGRFSFFFGGGNFGRANPKSLIFKNLERATGIEPVTSSLGSWHSTAELRPLSAVS